MTGQNWGQSALKCLTWHNVLQILVCTSSVGSVLQILACTSSVGNVEHQ